MADLRQDDLRSGATVRTCWLEARIKPGDRVRLKNSEDPLRWWDVVRTGEPQAADAINRGWHNNI